MRAALGALGVAIGLYGAYRLLALGWDNLVATVEWLVGGVVIHDGIIGPVLIVAGALAVRTLPERVRTPVTVGLVVLGTVTMTAIPVLGRFGARPDNPTLLDRNYGLGWLVFAVLVLLGTLVAIALGRPRRRRA